MDKRTTCSIEGCTKVGRITRGWCSMHYQRWKAHGDPAFEKPLANVGECGVTGAGVRPGSAGGASRTIPSGGARGALAIWPSGARRGLRAECAARTRSSPRTGPIVPTRATCCRGNTAARCPRGPHAPGAGPGFRTCRSTTGALERSLLPGHAAGADAPALRSRPGTWPSATGQLAESAARKWTCPSPRDPRWGPPVITLSRGPWAGRTTLTTCA